MMSLSSAATSQCLEATGGAEGGLSDRVDLLSRTRGSTAGRDPARSVDHCGDPAGSPISTNVAAGVTRNATLSHIQIDKKWPSYRRKSGFQTLGSTGV
jgi:hypothetical protein